MQAEYQAGKSNVIKARNYVDDFGSPAGGYAHGVGMCIAWQDGPRGKTPEGTRGPANGASVEDVLVAAKQRLQFFQDSRFASQENADAMLHIDRAIEYLADRTNERAARGVLGTSAV